MSDKILKLNQAQTLYNDLRERIEALPTDNDIPTKISDLTDDSGHYTKPATGIPTSDLSEEIVSTIDSKAPVIYCEKSGAIVSFDDGAGNMPLKECVVNIEPVQDLHGYDSPWPAGGGKNLFNPQVILAAGGSYSNDVYSATQAQLQSVDFTAIHFDENTQYYFYAYGKSNGENTGHAMRIKVTYTDESTSYISLLFNGSSYQEKSGTSTANKSIASIAFSAYGATVGSEFTKFMICKASDGTSYAPYENICPISGWTGAKVSRTGKNLIDTTGSTLAGSTVLIGTDSVKTFNYFLKAGTYTLSEKWQNNGYAYWRRKGTTDTNIIHGNNAHSGTFTLPADDWYRFWYYKSGDINLSDITEIMLEVGSTATTYEPYQGETYDITFPAEAGTVYGGTLDVVRGVLTVDRHYCVVNPNRVAQQSNTNGYFWYTTVTSLGIPAIKNKNEKLVSNRLVANFNVSEVSQDGLIAFYQNGIIRFKEQGGLSLDEYKAYLETNPLTICYELATPITYTLTPQEIKTLLGTNNIWADTGDTAVTYSADTKMFVEQNTPESPVQDVQINGTSIVTDGVANVPIGSNSTFGVLKVAVGYGTKVDDLGRIRLAKAASNEIKINDGDYKPITPSTQHESTFYGLAKAAGADMKDIANTTVGTYPDAQKEAIQSMLGITQMLAPTNPNLVASQPYAIGDVFAANGHLYKATAAIAQDEAIIPDMNCVETTMVDAGGKIKDVQINGVSIVGSDGVASVPIGSANNYGVLKTSWGITNNNGIISLNWPNFATVKGGTSTTNPITPAYNSYVAFCGLAVAAGLTTAQASACVPSANTFEYTDEAKTAIKAMLGVQDGLKVVRLI